MKQKFHYILKIAIIHKIFFMLRLPKCLTKLGLQLLTLDTGINLFCMNMRSKLLKIDIFHVLQAMRHTPKTVIPNQNIRLSMNR